MNRMPITTTSIAHVRLTVTDIARSRQFYDSVFGWPVFLEMPEDADEATRAQLWFLFGGVVYNIGDALLGLRPVATDSFDENRAGLDHIAFQVASKAELDAAAAHLDDLNISPRADQRYRPGLHPGVPRPGQHRPGTGRAEVNHRHATSASRRFARNATTAAGSSDAGVTHASGIGCSQATSGAAGAGCVYRSSLGAPGPDGSMRRLLRRNALRQALVAIR